MDYSDLKNEPFRGILDMNRVTIRQINELNVLREIFNQSPTSRASISKTLNLTKSTVYSIFTKLENDNLIYDIGQGSSTRSGGRKPALTNFNARAGYTVNIKINADTISCMTNWLDGSEITYQETPVTGDAASEYLLAVYQAIKSILIDSDELLGISVAVFGVVQNNHIVRSNVVNGLEKFDLAQVLQSRFNVPVVLGNEANLSALYLRDFTTTSVVDGVSLSLINDVSTGTIIDGKLYEGASNEAGEIGRACYYGLGADRPLAVREVGTDLAVIHQLESLKKQSVTFADIRRWYDNGDEDTEAVLHHFSMGVAIVLQNMLLALNPEKVVIASQLLRSIPEILEETKQFLTPVIGEKAPIELFNDVNRSVLLGGCALISRQVLGLSEGKLIFKNRSLPISEQ